MRTSEIHGKLIDRLRKARNDYVLNSLGGIETGDDASFILGNRIGKRVGMDHMIDHVIAFFTEEEQTDKSL